MILVIDNYDSFVFNLVHYLRELGAETRVIRNDELPAETALALGARAVVVSPGPCDPRQAGMCLELLKTAPQGLPILGVCLGHQAMGEALGGRVVAAREIVHGKTSAITHDGSGLFEGLPSPFLATRYHSLALERATLPAALRVSAETADGEIMGIAHVSRPWHGVQFHPESIASEHGKPLLANFLAIAGERAAAA